MPTLLSTGLVADLLRVPVHRLAYLTRDRQIRPPKGPTGAFVWRFEDVRAAAKLLGGETPTAEDFETLAAPRAD